MGTLKGFPNPPAMVRCQQSWQTPHAIIMGTLKGFPNPPAMVRRRQSWKTPHTKMADASCLITLGASSTQNRYPKQVPKTGTQNRYPKQVPKTGTQNRSQDASLEPLVAIGYLGDFTWASQDWVRAVISSGERSSWWVQMLQM
jgi:hypothetical protein